MSSIKVKDAGQTPDQFKTLVTNGNPIPEGTVAGNIIIADENAQTADSGVSVSSLLDGTQPVGDSAKLGGKSAESYYNLGESTKTIPSYTSLNNVTTLGHYYVDFSVASTLTDMPPEILGKSALFKLVVGHISTNRIFQMIIKHENSVYYRTGQIDGTWNGWERIMYASQVSNPNLLINGDFRVNQRGQTSYSGNGYTVDGWFNQTAKGTVEINNDGSITISANGEHTYFYQKFENSKELLGKTLTWSIKDSDGNIQSTTCTFPNELPTSSFAQGNKQLKDDIGRVYFGIHPTFIEFCIGVYDGKSLTLDYAKVELGNVATPYTPRPYAEELALCERYYLEEPVCFSGYTTGEGAIYIRTDKGMKMRVAPTVLNPPTGLTLRFNGNNLIKEVSSIAYAGGGEIKIIPTDTSGLSLQNVSGYFPSRLKLSAEL